jgi:hypothetical protein
MMTILFPLFSLPSTADLFHLISPKFSTLTLISLGLILALSFGLP